ncbi:branched-chain amino acid ABC transporter permease [Brevibacillus reuszeri]|uniref:ABC transporter permease n=1 Tax=Brevibacillus reuszeri TaxID=54915 RepID=A0A0K9YKY7_9BACL|nr:branched-chain amino acid ABC transporter permease [Brevibacillus reuszeri]KNB69408.1 ABC transporter permease [Brevibacillus reuszeri]MED1860276.1 branched-chain amino acid ABC transporter permease [Brevibacillus reuszeri]GED70835.1 branched-chain amino acid ABC transporter permease [Brevibacillus reuszeri]
MLAQQLLNGIALGFHYVLIALGLTMVYGVLRLLHFAHGVIYMIGAFAAMIGILYLQLPFAVALLLAMVVSGIVGMGIERFAYRPLRGTHPITTLISGVGISIFLENVFQVMFTSDSRAFPETGITTSIITLTDSITITNTKLYIIIAGVVCLGLLYAFLKLTKLGIAIQAAAQDIRAASLMGINVNRVVAVTFMLGSALAAVAGVLVAINFNSISPTMGALPGLKAFCVVVLGGLGSIRGTIVGGLLLGVVESLSDGFMTDLVIDKDAIAFVILIMILLIKPSGLFGKHIEKV